ncbi:hypothetical protein [Kordia sp.]|uniref:hypothetical protein n=1 Tax=Kordia sp. TaxID=1965332 RepID=UPI003B5A11F7
MKNTKLLFVILFLGLFLMACTQNQATSTGFENELSLLSIPDSLKKITIDYRLEEEALLHSIEKKIGENVCGATTNFGLILENEKPVNVYIHKICFDRMVGCFRRPREAKVLLNEKGMLLMAHELVDIDSIPQWMQNNYSKKEFKYTQTSIRWVSETPKDSIEKHFQKS